MENQEINGDKKLNKGRILVVGDIHGAVKALVQCLEFSKFDKEKDTLVVLGDLVDRWPDSYDVVQILVDLGSAVKYVVGNHDNWFISWLYNGIHPSEWTQGAFSTMKSYGFKCLGMEWDEFNVRFNSKDGKVTTNLEPKHVPQSHKDFFNNGSYWLKINNMCFVHGGFDRDYPIDIQDRYTLMWDRNLWAEAQSCTGDQKLKTTDYFSKIFLGHSTCYNKKNPKALPLKRGGVWNLDTGAGHTGKLTIMDVNTEEYWQSYWMKELYYDEIEIH